MWVFSSLGVERYSKYSGYGDTFKWDGDYVDKTPHDEFARRRTSVVALDATKFNRPTDQFGPSSMLRELNKVKKRKLLSNNLLNFKQFNYKNDNT